MPNDSLEQFIHQVSATDEFRVQDDLGSGFVRLRAAEAQRRQAKQDIRSVEDAVIELLRNSRDAHARAIFVASWTEGNQRNLTIVDDGDGIPANLHDTVFEPFVTSKLDSFHSDKWGVHGRGMALYSIRENTDDARIVASNPGLGSVFAVSVNRDKLSEKRDQSSLPRIQKDEEGKPVLRGPHNIARVSIEFAIEQRSKTAVYLGSPAEIVSAMYWLGTGAASKLSAIFDSWTEETPYLQRFALTDSPEALAALACELALPISDRTARRIMDQQVQPAKTLLELLADSAHSPAKAPSKTTKATASTNVKLAPEDLSAFASGVASAFEPLAQAYYLDSGVSPAVSVRGGELSVKIPLNPE